MAKAKRKYISKLKNKRWRINAVDSSGKPYRPTFATRKEAEDAYDAVEAKKAAGKKFVVGMGEAPFSEALDDLVELKKHENVGKGYRDGINSTIKKHLRPMFGALKLKGFADERMVPVDTWMKHQADHHHTSAKRLEFIRTVFSMTFDEAIRLGKMDPPNPVAQFKLQVPQQNQKEEREALTLDQMSALVKAVLTRGKEDRSELTWCSRWMMVLLGMLVGFRNEECSGLYWDSVHIEDRTIDMNRIWRDGEGIIEAAKSEAGHRTIPMSPILAAALVAYGQRLVGMGRKLEGPVLLCKAGIVKPEAISSQHWEVIARKAGLPDTSEHGRHTFYTSGRHTCLNLWRAVGIPLDTVAEFGGHDIKTSYSSYRHSVSISRFKTLGREVEALGIGRTPEDLIYGLGVVLHNRWRDEGIDVGCAPPRPSPSTPSSLLALPGQSGNIIDLVPNAVSVGPVEDEEPSIEGVRKRQIKRTLELHAQGWTKTRIAQKLHVDHTTVSEWIREANIPHIRGKHKPDVFKEKKAHFLVLRAEHRHWRTVELATALGVRPGWVTRMARAQKDPMPHVTPAYKLDQHEARIREMADGGRTFRQMERVLGVSFSAIALFAKKRGIKTKRWGGGERVDQYDADIIRLHAEGKNGLEIARELHTVHHSSIVRRIKALGLKSNGRGGRKPRT